jgi:uncharacterized protein YodC (DUF2158 family)
MEFKRGDAVVLKYGGPQMTILEIGNYPDAGISRGLLCAWFDGRETVEGIFDPETVESCAGPPN